MVFIMCFYGRGLYWAELEKKMEPTSSASPTFFSVNAPTTKKYVYVLVHLPSKLVFVLNYKRFPPHTPFVTSTRIFVTICCIELCIFFCLLFSVHISPQKPWPWVSFDAPSCEMYTLELINTWCELPIFENPC